MDTIEITPTSLLIIGAISLFLGMLATLLLNSLREDVPPAEEGADAPPGGKKGRYSPVARLWREKGSGRLVVEMDGRTLVTTEPLNDIQRERLEKAERDFRAWLGMGLEAVAPPAPSVPSAPQVPTKAQPAAAPVQSAPPAVPPAAPPPAQTASPATPPAQQSPPPIRTIPFTPPGVPPAVIPPAAAATRANRSIVEQIEDILQEMLVGTPLSGRGIHLHQDPARGVVVQVGLEYFDGIDSVPDPEIKSVLKSAVAAWEKSQ